MKAVSRWARKDTSPSGKVLLDQICRTIAQETKANAAFVARRVGPKRIDILGAFGTSIHTLGAKFALPRIKAVSRPILFVPNLSKDPDFKSHPLLTLFPTARSLFALVIEGRSESPNTILQIINPSAKLIGSDKTLALIHSLAEISEGIVEMAGLRAEIAKAAIGIQGEPSILIERSSMPAVLLDGRNRVIRVNQAMTEFLGAEVGNIENRDFRKFLTNPKNGKSPLDFKSTSLNMEIRTKKGKRIKCGVLPIPTTDGKVTATFLMPQSSTANREGIEVRDSIPGMQDVPSAPLRTPPSSLEPAGHFLLKTLLERHSLLKRNSCRYLALRSWRKSIKESQIAALTAVKATPSEDFVRAVAGEFVASVQDVYGTNHLSFVVPVPCGNSGKQSCLSTRLADRIARDLKIPMLNALEGQGGKGASTPRKSAALKAYHIKEPPTGTVLLVDDVASSGRHLELAASALRAIGCSVHAIVWIGGGS